MRKTWIGVAAAAVAFAAQGAGAAVTIDFGAAPGATDPTAPAYVQVPGWPPSYVPNPAAYNPADSSLNTLNFSSGGINLSVTGWHAQASGSSWTVSQAHLTNFKTDGLAVKAAGEDGSLTGDGQYQIDNINGFDFVLLSFSEAVTLSQLKAVSFGANITTFVPYNYCYGFMGGPPCYSWSYPQTTQVFDIDFAVDTAAGSADLVNALANGVTSIDVTAPAPGMWQYPPNTGFVTGAVSAPVGSKYWLVGAEPNPSGTQDYDAFKLTSVSFDAYTPPPPPVPEPATWAMMLAGFGAVGYSLRRRKGHRLLQAV